MALDLIILAIASASLSGFPGLFLRPSSAWGQRTAFPLMLVSMISGLTGAAMVLFGAGEALSAFPWPAVGGSFIGLDPLGAFFLVSVFLMGGLGSLYGLGYWRQGRYPRNARKLQVFWGLLTAGMGLLVIGRHAMAFLLGWEIMALSAFFLVSTEDQREESRRAGFLYIIATHIGTLTLFGMFVLWRWATGSYALEPLASGLLGPGVMSVLFLLTLLGFGLKAGMMPLHFWLPGAHANAPSHVSAMLSGVVLKMGIYGLVRFLSLIPDPPPAWGGLILALGATSGLLGVVFAIGQHDLKRLLAYHSVENIGIILMGLGLAMLGRSADRPEWIVLGLGGCFLHVWNHSLFKSLLFLGAGSVLHGAHTREIDRLGGLGRAMPWTAATFLVGAVAICGLPPLNGFVSELLIYLGLLRGVAGSGAGASTAVIVVPILAMIGALAVACFVKVYGVVFLGNPRTEAAARSHEAPLSMLAPMAALAACCALIGLAPSLVSPILDRVIASWGQGSASSIPRLASLVPLGKVGAMSLTILAAAAIPIFAVLISTRARRRVGTWDCGYARPTERMQYTSSSFAEAIVGLFSWVLKPRVHKPRLDANFPAAASMESHVDDAVLDRLIEPAFHGLERRFGWFRRFQQGLTQNYILYILVALIVLLGTMVPYKMLIARLFAHP